MFSLLGLFSVFGLGVAVNDVQMGVLYLSLCFWDEMKFHGELWFKIKMREI